MTMERQDETSWQDSLHSVASFAKRLEDRPPIRALAAAISGLLVVGSTAAMNYEEVGASVGESVSAEILCGTDCISPKTSKTTLLPATTPTETTSPPSATMPPSTEAPPISITTQPPTTAIQVFTATANMRIAALSPERMPDNIERMQLTREGYIRVLESINTDFYNYAQSNPKFNGAEMSKPGHDIPQGPTVFITKHVSATYYNADGTTSLQPVGDQSNPKLFIDKIAGRDGGECCGVNQFIDRRGIIYWLAPRAAKLRHNYGYDGQTTGDEIEAYLQSDITPLQLEASAYLDIGNLIVERKTDKPLEHTVRGHARTREEYNAAHPEDRQPAKVDWTEDFTAAYRYRLYEFITANPDLAAITPEAFRNLP